MSNRLSNATIRKLPPSAGEEEDAQRLPADEKSIKEVQQFASGKSQNEIERIAEENEAQRTGRFRDHFEKIAIFTLYVVWITLLVLFVVWTYHLIAAPGWPKLEDGQVRQMQTLLTGGTLGILGTHLKRRLQ